MLEKCCHDIDFYSMVVQSRPMKVSSFGGRRSFIKDHQPQGSLEEFTKYNLEGWEALDNVFDSDADIVDHQVAIVQYENGATLSFHTNMNVPDEFRRFAIIGSKGMAEGDFVRGFLKVHDSHTGKKIYDENYGTKMVGNENLTDEEIYSILEYIKSVWPEELRTDYTKNYK